MINLINIDFKRYVIFSELLHFVFLGCLIIYLYYMLEPNGWLASMTPTNNIVLTQELNSSGIAAIVVSCIYFIFILLTSYEVTKMISRVKKL